MKLQESVEYFLLVRSVSPSTRRTYSSRLRCFASFSDRCGIVEVTDLDETHIWRFFEYLRRERHCLENTIRGYGQTLHTFLRWLEGIPEFRDRIKQLIDSMPRPRSSRWAIEVLSEEEISSLLSTVTDGRDCAIIATFLGIGLRSAELAALCVDDVDFDKGRIIIRGVRANAWSKLRHFSERSVPLAPALEGILRTYLEQIRPGLVSDGTRLLFLNRRGGEISTAGLYDLVRRSLERAAIRKRPMGPRLLRRTFAYTLRRHGVARSTIAAVLGHSPHTGIRMVNQLFGGTIRSLPLSNFPDVLESAVESPHLKTWRVWNA